MGEDSSKEITNNFGMSKVFVSEIRKIWKLNLISFRNINNNFKNLQLKRKRNELKQKNKEI